MRKIPATDIITYVWKKRKKRMICGQIITVRNSSCGKLFSKRVPRILSMVGEVYTPWTHTPRTHTPWTHPLRDHCSGRYASYWNAFLLKVNSMTNVKCNSVFVLLKLLMTKYEEKSIKRDLIHPRNSQLNHVVLHQINRSNNFMEIPVAY